MQDTQAAYILVASDPIDLDDLCEHLNTDGLAVLNTTKPNASVIAHEAHRRLGIDDDGETTLTHIAVEVPGEGWWDLLCYSDASPVLASQAKPLIADAVRTWLAKGSPAYFATRIPSYALSNALSSGESAQLALA